MKPLLSYHGGKQTIARHIVNLMPPHELYVEPFFGGGAVMFAKVPSRREIINDTYKPLVTFYRVMQDVDKRNQLIERLRFTPFSRAEYYRAMDLLKMPILDEISTAWAVFVGCHQSFGHSIGSGFAKSRGSKPQIIKAYKRTQERLYKTADRLLNAEIWEEDARHIIEYFDTDETLFYCDPPYIGTNCGHYSGYSVEDYTLLLRTLSEINGTFILSGYPNPVADAMGFYVHDIEKIANFSNSRIKQKHIERLWSNKPFAKQLKLLGD